MNKTIKYIALSSLLGSIFLTGCSSSTESVYGDNTSLPELAETSIYETYLDLIIPKAYNDTNGLNLEPGTTISMIALGKSSDYWIDVKAGAEQAIVDINLDLGYTGKDAITLSYNTPSSFGDVEEMINILDSELSRYPAAIAIAISDPYAYGMQFDQALDNGIPIVAFESSSYSTTLSATVATDFVSMAKIGANKMVELIDNSQANKVLVIAPELTSDASSKKVSSIKEVIQNNSDSIELLDVFDLTNLTSTKMEMLADRTWVYNNLSGDNNTIASNPNHELYGDLLESIVEADVLTYVLNSNSDITGIISIEESCNNLLMDTFDQLELSPEDFKIISFGNNSKQLSYLEESKLNGLLISNPYGMGYATVVASIRAALDLGNEGLINPGTMWMDNL